MRHDITRYTATGLRNVTESGFGRPVGRLLRVDLERRRQERVYLLTRGFDWRSRPELINSLAPSRQMPARRSQLNRGTLTYPRASGRTSRPLRRGLASPLPIDANERRRATSNEMEI